MTFDDKNMIQICSQILEFSDHSNAKHFSSASWQIPSKPVFPWSTLEDPFPCLGPVSGDVWNGSYLHWVDATKSCRTHTDVLFHSNMYQLYIDLCVWTKTHLDLWESVVGHWSLLGGSIFLAVLLALSPSNLLMNSGQNTIIFRDKKTSICSFFFLTIYELMIKNLHLGPGQPRRSSLIFLLKTSIFTLVEPILVAFRPPKNPGVLAKCLILQAPKP